jgi:hypothetical protein
MEVDDFDAVVKIDEKVLKARRQEYYALKFEKLVQSKDYVPASLVAQEHDGTVVGFVIGELYIGEYGISQGRATLDSIGPGGTSWKLSCRSTSSSLLRSRRTSISAQCTLD